MEAHKSLQKAFEEITKFDLSETEDLESSRNCSIAFWIPEDLRDKYNLIQLKTRGKFGKAIKQIILKSIDSVNVD